MKLLSPRTLFLAVFLISSASLLAQETNFNRWSVELTTGVHVPLAPGQGISRKKYIAFKQFELAGRYMFTDKIGLKGHYGFNRFANPDDNKMGVTFHRIGMEGVVNVGKLLNIDYRLRERLGLLFHTGVGVTFANSEASQGTDHIGNFLVGFTGQVKLNESFTLLGDMTYIGNMKQHYAYNGQRLIPFEATSGGFVNVSVGIMYNLGEGKYH
ncbi:MAG TPA: hypothetical protein VKX40_05010, partial [Aequorivita sp.]|nr:hypothetical protein [Aequorivita sp.]